MKIGGSNFFPVKALKRSSFFLKLVAMDDIRNLDCLRVVLLLTDILRAINSFSVVCKCKASTTQHLRVWYFAIVMSTKRKRSVLSIKDKQAIIQRSDQGAKGTHLSLEYDISKQQISGIRKNREKIMKFADNIETSAGLQRKSSKVAGDLQLDKALYAWFIQRRTSGAPISGPLQALSPSVIIRES